MARSERLIAHLCALVTALMWSFSFVCIRDVLQQCEAQGATPGEAMLLLFQTRIGLSAVFYVPHLVKHRRLLRTFCRRDWGLTICVLFLGTFAYHLPLNLGAQFLPSGFVSLIIASSPLFAAVFAAWLLRERLDLTKGAGVLLGLAGVCLCLLGQGKLAWVDGRLEITSLIGPGAVLVAALAGALFSVTGRRLRRDLPNSLILSLALIGAAALALPFWDGGMMRLLLGLNLRAWLGIVYLAGCCLYLASMLWLRALRELDTVAVMIYLNMTTVMAMFWGAWLFGERFSSVYLLGAALVLGAVVLVNWPWRHRGARVH